MLCQRRDAAGPEFERSLPAARRQLLDPWCSLPAARCQLTATGEV
jgi:hypothetical protein